jgi:penicillin-binding protein 1A
MNTILIKIFATALALSQVTARPDAVKTQFDPQRDRSEVAQILRDGCTQMRKTFDIEDINLDDLIKTAMDDPEAMSGEIKALRGIKFSDLFAAYREFCKGETVANSAIDLGQVIDFYNSALADLPDHKRLKGLKLPGMSLVLDANGGRFAELYTPENRRIWTPLADIPELVQKAFVAAEDKRFFQHNGIDERGLVRAFIGNLAQPGRPQGGSTITQQVAKNLLVGNDVTYERKLREVILAARLEHSMTKAEILELYLNSIYLGRGSWGVEMAARSYFDKPVKALTLAEGAVLAGLVKGPSYFNPDRNPERIKERVAYVLGRMQEDAAIGADQVKQGMPPLAAYDRPRQDSGFHFVDQLSREAKSAAGIDALTTSSYVVRSTINPVLQRATEASLQEGLARYELNTGRFKFLAPEANIADAIAHVSPEQPAKEPAWQTALKATRLPLYDVHWLPAVVVQIADKRGEAVRVGLADGRILPLNAWNPATRRALKLYDVVYVVVREGKGRDAARAELRVRPSVQGAALVLENKSGRILAMAGGFSYPLSQLNRATQSLRQPGSTLKPLSYLAALRNGLQPNTLVLDEPITLPPIGGDTYARQRDYWTPKNFEGGAWGAITLRRALENSRNLATAHLLDGGIDGNPEESLDRVCQIAMEAQLYHDCVRYYPFVLGAQPLHLIDLAAFYAAVAGEGARPSPHAIESIEQDGRIIYRPDPNQVTWIGSADRASLYQLKTMLQGVVARGTARSLRQLAPYVGGKTGTSEDENDAWFVGFTNDVTIAVWVGNDNGDGQRRTLGRGETGAKVALPIFEQIIQAAWNVGAPKTPLSPPSPDAMRNLVAQQIDFATGDVIASGGGKSFTEYFRKDAQGGTDDTQYRLVSRDEADAYRPRAPDEEGPRYGSTDDRFARQPFGWTPFWNQWQRNPPPQTGRGFFDDDERAVARPRRVDPDYPWAQRRFY